MLSWTKVRVAGPLAPYARGFGRELRSCGFTDLSTAEQLRLMSHLSRWMTGEGLDALSCEQIAAYCAARKAGGYVARLTPGSLGRLQVFLRAQGVLSASPASRPPASAEEELLGRYRAYLAEERGLVPAVISQYLRTAALFLDEYPGLPPGSGGLMPPRSVPSASVSCRGAAGQAPRTSRARCGPSCASSTWKVSPGHPLRRRFPRWRTAKDAACPGHSRRRRSRGCWRAATGGPGSGAGTTRC